MENASQDETNKSSEHSDINDAVVMMNERRRYRLLLLWVGGDPYPGPSEDVLDFAAALIDQTDGRTGH